MPAHKVVITMRSSLAGEESMVTFSLLREINSARSILSVLLCLIIFPSLSHSYELLIGTGERGSFSYYAGKAVCRSIHKYDKDVTCRPVPSESYTDNLTNVQGGSIDLALVNSKMIYDAFHGAGLFEYVTLDYGQLRLLMPLYRMPISLLVRRDARIGGLEELADKKVNAGSLFSLQEIIFRELMSAKGWSEGSFRLYQNLSSVNAQDYIALHNGSVQAMLHIGMHPDRKLENSLVNGHTKIVGITGPAADSLLESDSGFYRQSIPQNTYVDYSDKIDTLALETLLISSADLDTETVELVLNAIIAARPQLRNAHPAFLAEAVNVETLNASYLHPHPAAILFFQTNQNRL
jgi:TRAP transporter TAXI family solute receptor